jgi:hypothetical protein
MSPNSPPSPSDSDSQDEHNHSHPNSNNTNSFTHHIKPTFLGPVCTSCQSKVAKGNILFDVSRVSIKKHITTNKCFSGDITMFKGRELEKSLHTSMLHHHKFMRDNPSSASRKIDRRFQFVSSTKNLPYCAKCGFIGTQLCHVKRHTKSQSTNCTESDVRSADESIVTNQFGFLLPRTVLNKMKNGTFILPTKRTTLSNTPTRQPANPSIAVSVIAPTFTRNHHATQSLFTPPRRIITPHSSAATNSNTANLQIRPTHEEIVTALSNNSPFKDAVSLNPFTKNELGNTFASKEHSDSAYEYLASYILLINQQTPGLLRNTLTNYSTMMKPSTTNTTLQLIIRSGKLWLQSNAANMDVKMVPVHHRNNIYLVGSTHSDTDKDLLKGGTFVGSNNFDTIAEQFMSLLSFTYEIQWPSMTAYTNQADEVYLHTQEDPSYNDEDEYALAAAKMVDTNIIFGLLSELLLEQPSVPNGPNVVYKYLAGLTVRIDHNGAIHVRHPNEISKKANALLRLFRHGVCSLYIRKSQLMAQQQESHKTFEVWANALIREMQVCPSVGHICRTIRTAREVDRKTPSLVKKAFNDKTGELFVGGSQIHKSTWSVAIPTAISEWDKHLNTLFPNHSQASTLPLTKIFNLNNDIVMAGEDTFLTIDGTTTIAIPLNAFKPTLPQ